MFKKVTVQAPANIAFIKYWGKQDATLRIPWNDSISMNLSSAFTTTTVEFSQTVHRDEISFINEDISEKENQRTVDHLNRFRKIKNTTACAKVVTKNSFPKGTGIASSASGFAALTIAASAALSLSLSQKELTILARLGSGSACRSIPDGFVLWHAGNASHESFAESLHPSTYWSLFDILVIVSHEHKKISSTEGMENVHTSKYWVNRLKSIPNRIDRVKKALQKKDFPTLGTCIEEDCLDMHHVMQTQHPSLNYWNTTTQRVMSAVLQCRKEGIPVYFTIDAGPNVHLICQEKQKDIVSKKIKEIKEVQSVVVNAVAPGARCIDTHLF